MLILLLTGCGIGDIRRPVPTERPSQPPASSDRPPDGPDEVRRTRVPVPSDFQQTNVEFVDAERGYALFTRCGQDIPGGRTPAPNCKAIVLSTADGGRSWHQLRHPRPVAENHQMYADRGLLLLLAEPGGWYASSDAGRTFTRQRTVTGTPPIYWQLFGRFQVCCDAGPSRVVELVNGRLRPLAVQPPVPGLATVASGGHRLAAAGVKDGRPYAALSFDHGETWLQAQVPAPDVELISISVAFSLDGNDAWLIGRTDDRLGFPPVWRLSGPRWVAVSAAGHPREFISAAPLGAGLLAITAPDVSGVIVVDHFSDQGWPIGGLRLLSDGALQVTSRRDDAIWLGVGAFANRRWIRLELDRFVTPR